MQCLFSKDIKCFGTIFYENIIDQSRKHLFSSINSTLVGILIGLESINRSVIQDNINFVVCKHKEKLKHFTVIIKIIN